MDGHVMEHFPEDNVARNRGSAVDITRKKDEAEKENPDNRSVKEEDDDAVEDDKVTVEVPRNIGLFGGIAFIVGSIIGSGIFVSPRGVASGSGSVGMSMVNWTICGLISLLGALCYAELGTVIRQSGGDYSYLHFSFGGVVSYSLSWVMNILIKPASMATITLTCAQYIMTPLFDDGCGEAPEYIKKIVAIVVVFILAAVNVYSTKLSSRIQIFFTVAKLVALLIIIIGGIVKLCQGFTEHLATGFDGTESNPGSIAVGLYSGMWAYDGWNTANYMTEEIINPKRNLPLSIAIGVPLVMIVYILTNISYFSVLSIQEIIDSPAVAVSWADIVMPQVAWIIPIFVAMSTFGAGNGNLCSGGRLMFVAARNEHLPDVLAMVHVNTYTPSPAIMLTSIIGIIFLLSGDIDSLIDFISFIMWLYYGLNMLAVIIFRYKKPYKDYPRPVKIPLVIPILVFLASIFLVFVPIITSPQIEFLFAVVFILAGFLFYIPFVHFRLRFGCTSYVTKFFQLYLQVLKPTDINDLSN